MHDADHPGGLSTGIDDSTGIASPIESVLQEAPPPITVSEALEHWQELTKGGVLTVLVHVLM